MLVFTTALDVIPRFVLYLGSFYFLSKLLFAKKSFKRPKSTKHVSMLTNLKFICAEVAESTELLLRSYCLCRLAVFPEGLEV